MQPTHTISLNLRATSFPFGYNLTFHAEFKALHDTHSSTNEREQVPLTIDKRENKIIHSLLHPIYQQFEKHGVCHFTNLI